MKVIVRTMIIVGILNLVMTAFVMAQGAVVEKVEETAVEVKEPAVQVQPPAPAPAAVSISKPVGTNVVTRRRILRRGPGSRVLVIPTEVTNPKQITEVSQDLRVMLHIFDKKFSSPKHIGDVFVDFGPFFSRDKGATQAIYLEDYGILFLMSVNFPLSAPPKAEEEEGKEPVDTEWQQAQDELFSGKRRTVATKSGSAEVYDAEKIKELKKDLVKSLKHAANIRNLKQDECIIITVRGGARQGGEMMAYDVVTTHSRFDTMVAGGGYGGGYGGGGGAGFGGGAGGMVGDAGTLGGEDSAGATVMTIRAKKSDVDDFAEGKLNFEQFQEKVKILIY